MRGPFLGPEGNTLRKSSVFREIGIPDTICPNESSQRWQEPEAAGRQAKLQLSSSGVQKWTSQ